MGAGLGGATASVEAQEGKLALNFAPVGPGKGSEELLANGHVEQVLLRWGDPILAGAPAFDLNNQSAAAQAQQFGYNCDFLGYFPLPRGSDDPEHGHGERIDPRWAALTELIEPTDPSKTDRRA